MTRRGDLLLVAITAGLIAWLALRNPPSCVSERRVVTIRGTSLVPMLMPGAEQMAEMGYYACQPTRVGELVLHHYAGNEVAIAKLVKAVGGDRVTVEPCARAECINVNGERVLNSLGEPYYVTPQEKALLALYPAQVPDDAVMLLSNRSAGTIDSRRFGLVAKSDLLARLVPR